MGALWIWNDSGFSSDEFRQLAETGQCLSGINALFSANTNADVVKKKKKSNWYLAPASFSLFCFTQSSFFYHMVVTDCLSWKEKPFEAN